jgi:SAM-dependent methyltransferase
MQNKLTKNLKNEALSYDLQIEDRIKNGHIPDLRRTVACDYFFNNPWRRPAYVELHFVEQFSLIKEAISKYCNSWPPRVLEVGCGPGHISLELAREGFEVIGIDVSEKAINVAKKFHDDNPFDKNFGSLSYFCGDFLSDECLSENYFDAIIFVGTLCRFPDTLSVISNTKRLLKNSGILIAHEPVPGLSTMGNAVFVHLLHTLLSVSNGFYTPAPPFVKNQSSLNKQFAEINSNLLNNSTSHQSHDLAGYSAMRSSLDANFSLLEFDWRYAFFHAFIGGLRFDDATNESLAFYLREVDRKLCQLNVLSPTEFFYVGRKIE